MSVSRNFFLGREINKGLFLDLDKMSEITRQEMAKLGIDVADPNQPIGTLSGGRDKHSQYLEPFILERKS